MKRLWWALFNFSLLIIPSVSLMAQASFREELNLGVQAFREAKYDDAIRHFQNATALRPENEVAHLYLATAYAQQYIPGVETHENVQFGEAALSEYQKILEINPKYLNSLKGVAYLLLQMKKFEDAKTYYRKAIEVDAADPESYYSIGVIDWAQAYTPRMKLREKFGLETR